jgi:hypothetical protein
VCEWGALLARLSPSLGYPDPKMFPSSVERRRPRPRSSHLDGQVEYLPDNW